MSVYFLSIVVEALFSYIPEFIARYPCSEYDAFVIASLASASIAC